MIAVYLTAARALACAFMRRVWQCGHVCMCCECTEQVFSHASEQNEQANIPGTNISRRRRQEARVLPSCPVCRKEIHQSLKVFF